jgi:hypothetical protein
MSRKRKPTGAGEYSVGYGRPPLESRFVKGRSGNLNGRPKGQKNLKTLVRQAMTAPISVREGSRKKRVPKLEAVVLRQMQAALKGSDRSAMALLRMASQLGFFDDLEGGIETPQLSGSDEQILEELLRRKRRARRS